MPPSDTPETYSYPQNDLDHDLTITSTPLDIYHAPFSLLHIETNPTNDDHTAINFDVENKYYLPRTQEILVEELSNQLKTNVQKLPLRQQTVIANEYVKIHEDNKLYGEYLPQTYTKSPNETSGITAEIGDSLDPLKYITNFLIQRHFELAEKKQEIVLHPDIIYFASQGRKENIPKVLNYLNTVANTLDQKLFFENLTFSNIKFKEALGTFEDPMKIYDFVKDYSNLGIVIDLNHIEKSHLNIDIIGNIEPQKLIIHARPGYQNIYSGAYKYCISKAIPWVVE
ncbi:MAG: hypothetical protein UR96_C0002G0012 [candidate division WS6 bacterium GW2011_GWC1_36_11]|uniref:Uncharacterized protein n=3 Tax=Candidatus Dojkabacteria TaxID=74243 RepID=A0A0G0DHU5_9BACT|nr:MAG: hypothetical protein UR96_C0002G0012 [candidate division WS6 bacterium GW2011_GWC1_36_11]KKQ04643.1 MAG: hypothetical protein US14_C0003G0006 [candidate division WS6 bacterium GW2011_WS6_36_26]KKQ11556.1 MAG: hypothetical protein US24_C0023G0002 [candidate division WS6 bacterium GW2011_GWC2_36_7]KKQ17047.1 MAG: hypothetical protein US29_C0013G0004 [candidate division WS6 bacterium GW2011_GWF1_36_8]HAM37540.1 hypothetical protein [Patescibacteria group bacterium]